MSLVLKLPTELLSEIAESLVQNKEQAALAALARSSRLFYYIANPLLYRQPFITNFEQIADWVSTLEEWTDELSYDGALRNLPRMSSLFFEGLSGSRPPPPMCCIFCRSDFHESDLHFEHLHLIRRYVDAPFFDHLRALSFVDCEAPNDLLPGLFGPKGRLRSTLRELTLVRTGPHHNANLQFLLHLLHFFPDTRVWANEHWRRMLQDGEVEYMTEEALKAKSLTEFEAFDFLQVGAEGTLPDTITSISKCPPSPHPFASLTTLKLGLVSIGAEEIFIALCSDLLPVLRRLSFSGTFEHWILVDEETFLFRRAVHHPPPRCSGELRPPQLSGQLPAHENALWLPLSAEEVASNTYKDYRGPSLDLLDLSELKLNLTD